MTDGKDEFFVSADWLEDHLDQPGLSIVDASWYLPAQQRDAHGEYEAGHIPGAVFFDQDLVVEPGVDLPHAMPSPSEFARHVGAMGITSEDKIVIYDGPGLFSAPRVWWLFRVMGAKDVHLLAGGLDRWKKENRTTTTEKTKTAPSYFETEFDPDAVVSFDEMRQLVANRNAQIVDARPRSRFTAEEPEPRAGMRGGHMPHARNVPVMELIENGQLKSDEELAAEFEKAGVDMSGPLVTSCGSGVTAATLVLALRRLGKTDVRLYDGSWSEWGSREDTDVVTGAP